MSAAERALPGQQQQAGRWVAGAPGLAPALQAQLPPLQASQQLAQAPLRQEQGPWAPARHQALLQAQAWVCLPLQATARAAALQELQQPLGGPRAWERAMARVLVQPQAWQLQGLRLALRQRLPLLPPLLLHQLQGGQR